MTHLLSFVALNIILLGCASEPPVEPPPPPTIVNLEIVASDNLNADSNGNGAPVMMRIYELSGASNFNATDFFALFNDDSAALGADLERKQDFLLKPGETKKLSIKPDEEVTSLGFFAAFRQLDTARWRAIVPVQPHQTQSYLVKLVDNQLTVEMAQLQSVAQEP